MKYIAVQIFQLLQMNSGGLNLAATGCCCGGSEYKYPAIACILPAICKSIYDCPPILNELQNQSALTPTKVASLRKLACRSEIGRYPHVCCPIPANTPVSSIINPSSNGLGNILPSKGSCGLDSLSRRIYGGQATALDEFPWMALLEYSKTNGVVRSLSCGGVLINQRYVLTAAHCLVGEIKRKIGKLINVRLGEYDISTPTDCLHSDCADPVQNVGVAEVIPHPNFKGNNRNRTFDVGLVRLAKDVAYSDFIKPICLPSTIEASKSAPMTSVIVAGWGRTLKSRYSNVKQKLQISVVDQSECGAKFAAVKSFIDDSQLCAGGNYLEDTCDGDSGGPLMKFTKNYWIVEGIVSFGRTCGSVGWPGVYTRVSSYEDWIKYNMKP